MPQPLWSYDKLESWLSLRGSLSSHEMEQLFPDLRVMTPGLFAMAASEGRWKRAPHLKLLDRAIMESLQEAKAGQLFGLIVSMPPQHGKSELCSKYLPAWYLGTHPNNRVILTSYEADFAAGWGRKSRDLLEQHGDWFGIKVSRRSSSVHRWDIEGHEGGMTTAGVGGPITGRGAHLLIIDDPVKNDEEARSPTHRQKNWDWWQSTASTRLRPGALVVVIQTRWHRDDLTGKLLQSAALNGQKWRVIKLPAIAEENDPLGRAPGKALWPEVYTLERLKQVQASRTAYFWKAMYQQDPLAEGGTEWPESYFGSSIWFDEWPTEWNLKLASLDPSKGNEARGGDYGAFVKVMVGRDGNLYVDADLGLYNCEILSDIAVEIVRDFRPDGFAIEVNQFQELLAHMIQQRCINARVDCTFWKLTNTVNKLVRIRRLTDWLAKGNIRFKRDSHGARLLVDQLREFPTGAHDDGPDALEMAIRMGNEIWNQMHNQPPPEQYIYA